MLHEVIGKYKIIKELGSGGMGTVYLAEHSTIKTKVAIKALHKHLFKNENIEKRFLREAKMQAILDHPNITKVIDFIDNDSGLFIILEYIEGEELDKYLFRSKGLMPEKDAKHYMSKILDAVGYAHSKGIIHRDLKSANIMISANGEIKIMDFGIAKLTDDNLSLTKTGSRLGSPLYMSPEQVTRKKGQVIDHRSDIYSLGVVYHEMLTGKPIYDQNNTSEYEIYDKIVKEPLPRLKTYYKLISDQAQSIVDKATSKSREDRFQSCLKFKEAIALNDSYPDKPYQEKTTKPNYIKIFGIIFILIAISFMTYSLISENAVIQTNFFNNKQKEDTTQYQLDAKDTNRFESNQNNETNSAELTKLSNKEYEKALIANTYSGIIQLDSIKNLTQADTLIFRTVHNHYHDLVNSFTEIRERDTILKDTSHIQDELHYIEALNKYHIASEFFKKGNFNDATITLTDVYLIDTIPYIAVLKQAINRKKDSITLLANNQKKVAKIEKEKRNIVKEKVINDLDEVEEPVRQVIIPANLSMPMVDKAPVFPGCDGKNGILLRKCTSSQINKYIESHIDVNNLLGRNLPKGNYQSVISFTITDKGRIANVYVNISNEILKNEIIRVVKSIPYMSPAIYESLRVPIQYKLTLTTSIQ